MLDSTCQLNMKIRETKFLPISGRAYFDCRGLSLKLK